MDDTQPQLGDQGDDQDSSGVATSTPAAPEPAPVQLSDDLQLEHDVHASVTALQDLELADGQPVSDNVAGRWAVYDNSELRFWPGLDTYPDQDAAQRELDLVRPSTGHDLVVVEV